ncbi:uncharacterized protein Z520_00493 [Fonsecaea multimorphosa CBS 102226]|uniref:Heme oxygenase-like protein n=1 Tax=Fonsecaea multimorphosa CBS 102226 TaxID=1442371 RepID=A0A0D2J2Y7_9EURO|nr:uncharacterized protein Z520_00493 [Fonsecaea multimorphosa CBS 102226]KIY03802.1 hypothetical protein Z520_00493 [Fonsecaea multimorphosa CBS 102226]OAL32494.1 hypothetical protein AYO22_00516 [Fonsecaea multimorphosa]
MNAQPEQNESAQSSLPEELRATTRQRHHALNAQITQRLPLSLPPIADSPFNYTKGLIVFGQIYFAFENFLETQLVSGQLDQRLLHIYERVCFSWLLRSSRLQTDIDTLKSQLLRSQVEELEALVEESRGFRLRIERALSARPHVMLAYTWTMYLALFNGGRWIRRQLVSAGPEFWRPGTPPLSFWDFHSEEDVDVDERLKGDLKEGFREAASTLTDSEQRDVVQEALNLFDLCTEMVDFLDHKTTTRSSRILPEQFPSLIASPQLNNSPGANSTAASLWQFMVSACSSLKITASTARRHKAASAG